MQIDQPNLNLVPMSGEHLQKFAQLENRVARAVVRIDQVLGLGQAQPQAFGPQYQLDPSTVARVVKSNSRAKSLMA